MGSGTRGERGRKEGGEKGSGGEGRGGAGGGDLALNSQNTRRRYISSANSSNVTDFRCQYS